MKDGVRLDIELLVQRTVRFFDERRTEEVRYLEVIRQLRRDDLLHDQEAFEVKEEYGS